MTSIARNKAKDLRPGISLLEVIITMGVLTIGLLGLAALLPVGHYHNTMAENADRSATCGRMAFREIETRDMLNPEHWVRRTTNAAWPTRLAPMPAASPARPYDGYVQPTTGNPHYVRTFMIDPLLVAANFTDTTARSRIFPHTPAAGGGSMSRCSLDYLLYGPPNPNTGIQSRLTQAEAESAADQLFTCRDDVAMAPPAIDAKGRPLLAAKNQTSIHGDYSWMAMVSPLDAENSLPLNQRRMYNVAVIVMYKRVPAVQGSPPSEQQVAVTTVLGPRAVHLDRVEIKITPNQWIMLSGELQPPRNQTGLRRWLYRWYRVVSASKEEVQPQTQPPTPPSYRLHLAGPDWNPGMLKNGGPTYATIVDKVVGVFERTVELDVRSLTSK